ncbi:MAG: diguanylate cyclase domain-containing protein [Nocardioides sp.]
MGRARVASWLFVGQALLVPSMVVLYLANRDLASVCLGVVAVGAATGVVLGPWVHRSTAASGWWRMGLCCVMFGISSSVQAGTTAGAGPGGDAQYSLGVLLVPEVFAIVGYALALSGAWRLLHPSRTGSAAARDVVLDVGVLASGGLVIAVQWLITPAALFQTDTPAWLTITRSVYPIIDVAMLAILALAWFSTRERSPSMVLFSAAVAATVTGDIVYTIGQATAGSQAWRAGWEVPYLLSSAFIGLAALHPTMVQLGQSRPIQQQPWSRTRLALLAPGLAAPVVVLLDGAGPALARTATAVGTMLILVLLTARATWSMRQAQHAQDQAQRSRDRFEQLARHDPLTGLANRSRLIAELQVSLSRGDLVNVLFIDLDGFKAVNDRWGHRIGDVLLCQVAERMARLIPPGGLLSRFGGDEFVVVVPAQALDEDNADLARRLITAVSRPYELPDGEARIGASVGIAIPDTPHYASLGADELIRRADTAMYQAKESNQPVIYSSGQQKNRPVNTITRVRDRTTPNPS